jgi:hypothetical protein
MSLRSAKKKAEKNLPSRLLFYVKKNKPANQRQGFWVGF